VQGRGEFSDSGIGIRMNTRRTLATSEGVAEISSAMALLCIARRLEYGQKLHKREVRVVGGGNNLCFLRRNNHNRRDDTSLPFEETFLPFLIRGNLGRIAVKLIVVGIHQLLVTSEESTSTALKPRLPRSVIASAPAAMALFRACSSFPRKSSISIPSASFEISGSMPASVHTIPAIKS
jgi:hypothetical protein